MKREIIELLGAVMLTSCTAIDIFEPARTLGTGKARSEVLASSGNGRADHNTVPSYDPGSGFRKDTALYVSALEFPDGYDWRKDTAYLRSGVSIILFRNGERVMTLPAGTAEGIGTGADMHHIIQGHLVTEYCGSNGTTVKMDGKEVFRSTQQEMLRGLLMDGDKLISLSQRRNGNGFVYRHGGSVILDRSNGELIGNLGDDIHFSSGALYLDKGCICFAYRSSDNAILVEDGVEKTVPCRGDILDLRRIGGSTCLLESEGSQLLFTVGDRSRDLGSSYITARRGCHISVAGSEPVALCQFDSRYGTASSEIHQIDKALRKLMGIHAIVPCDGGFGYISHDPAQWISITGIDSGTTRYEEPYLWMGIRACCSIGSRIVVAATPYMAGGVPEIIKDGKKERLELNGFVTGVSSVINHPS